MYKFDVNRHLVYVQKRAIVVWNLDQHEGEGVLTVVARVWSLMWDDRVSRKGLHLFCPSATPHLCMCCVCCIFSECVLIQFEVFVETFNAYQYIIPVKLQNQMILISSWRIYCPASGWGMHASRSYDREAHCCCCIHVGIHIEGSITN